MIDAMISLTWMMILLCAVVFERASGFPGIFFVTSFVGMQFFRGSWIGYACMFIIAAIADLVFLRPLGMTGLTMGLAFFVWTAAQRWSRWRLLLYIVLGFAATEVFSVIDTPQSSYLQVGLISLLVLLMGWIVMKFLPSMDHHPKGMRIRE